MPKAFPVPPTFPSPDFLSEPVFPQSPRLTSQMGDGHVSVLRVSRVQVGATFVAQWNSLTTQQLLIWQEFWATVDTWDVVSLPLGTYPSITGGFWSSNMTVDLANLYIRCSPTGWWRMRVPKIEQLGISCDWTMAIEFEGVLD
jgi:hypothetical protein